MKKFIKEIFYWLFCGKNGYRDLRVLSGPAKGCRLRLDLRKEGSYWLGNYDKWIFDAVPFDKIIKPGFVIWDCGAYVGYYTAAFRKIIGDRGIIYVFEASKKNYERLKFLPELNKWDNIRVINMAVGPDHAALQFVNNLGGGNGPYNLSKVYKQSQSELDIEIVKCSGIDELVYELGIDAPDFIKFDLESAEEFALHNGDKVFKGKRPLILLELHGEKTKEAAGLFFEKYHYGGVIMASMPDATQRIRSLKEFRKINGIPHMVFCIPDKI